MPEQDVNAGELNKAREVLDLVLPSGDGAAEVVHPCEETGAPGSRPVFWRANLGAASVCATLYASVKNRREPGAIDIESSEVKKALLSPPQRLSWR